MATHCHADTIRAQLGNGPRSSRQLAEIMGMSQPTVSRALAALGDEVVRIGSGPSIHYALRDSLRGVSSAPIYQVSADGKIRELGVLVPVRPSGYVLVQANGGTLHGDGLPWRLLDMRPQGYLGRAYASAHAAELNLPTNPELWGDADIITALVEHGYDAIGNLLIGEKARDQFIEMPLPRRADRAAEYPVLAQAASTGNAPGFFAGGEQPKFCAFSERGHVLVKFTEAGNNPISERWRDLLLAEHLALAVLGVETEIFDFASQRFLEVPRFDRAGPLGRVGVISLRALDAEFVGDVSAPWPSLVRRLAAAGHVQTEAIAGTELLWAFGTLIGNTDMHAGNLSFIGNQDRPYQLAPAYDVLPMVFAPKRRGAIVDTLSPATLSASVEGATWRETLRLAEQFLAKLRDCDGFSRNFLPCIEALRRHVDDAASRIARIG